MCLEGCGVRTSLSFSFCHLQPLSHTSHICQTDQSGVSSVRPLVTQSVAQRLNEYCNFPSCHRMNSLKQAENQTLSLLFCTLLPCKNLLPTLPTMQQLCVRLVCAKLVAANVASSRDWERSQTALYPPPLNYQVALQIKLHSQLWSGPPS